MLCKIEDVLNMYICIMLYKWLLLYSFNFAYIVACCLFPSIRLEYKFHQVIYGNRGKSY